MENENNNNNEFPKILIVEDNEAERNSLKVALEAESFIVESVENASDVEKLVNLSEFDVALVDYELSDGLNLIEKMKLPAPELMFLVINANNSVNSSIEIFRAGAYNFMTKPLDIPALVKTINVMIKERNVAVSSKVKFVELQSKAGINYKYNDERISIITTPNPDMLINDKAKVNIIKIFKRIFETVKNFYW
ncbi:MAG: response regulator [Elusimicrobia bacterium]|nr:response regulator [Elusimicrobiota bacterium]